MGRTPSGIRRLLAWPAVLLLYVSIQCIYWAPHWRDFFSRFVGEGYDNYIFVWNAWWLTRCLHLHQNPLFCDLQYAPYGTPLAFHCLTILPALIIAAVSELASIQLAYNLVEVGLCVFGGVTTFALARHLTKDAVASAVGGAVFMLSPFMTSKLVGHMNLSCAALLPLYTLCLLRAIDGLERKSRAWLTISYLLILLSSEQTIVFAANVTAWYWLFRSVRSGAWREETKRFARTLAPILAISAAWAGVLLYYMLRYRVFPTRHGPLASCPEPLCYLLPIHSLSMWREWFTPPGASGTALRNLELATYLGWIVLPMAAAGFWCHRQKHWAQAFGWIFIFALVISLGPKLQWHRETVRAGRHGIHLPMDLYQHVPLLGMIGQSGRYMVIAYMCMAVGVAALLTRLRARTGPIPRRLLPLAGLAVICLDYAYIPVTCAVPVSPITPGNGRVMEARGNPARSIYRQTLDGRTLVGGYISRPPEWIEQNYRAMAGIGWFFTPSDRRGDPPPPNEVNNALLAASVDYVWVNPGSGEQRLLEQAGWIKFWSDHMDALMSHPASTSQHVGTP